MNFVTQEEEEAVAGPAIRACMVGPAIQACHRMHVVADGDVVLRVTVWPAGSVAPEDVPHVTSLWTARATVALFCYRSCAARGRGHV